MNKLVKVLLISIGTLIVIVIGGLGYVNFFLPSIPLKDVKVEVTPDRVIHGEYLANHVMVCMDCHSVRDWSLFSGPIAPGTLGAGGDEFTPEMGFPGYFYAPNITPYHLKDWSDAEIYRAITSGVNKSGKPLFPVMPYHSYGKLDDEDIYSVIAYLRTLEPITKDIPVSEPDFPMSLIMHLIPQKNIPSARPDSSDKISYGKYLTTAAACADCHTPFEKGQPVAGMEFAGGREFEMPFGTLRTPNITPDRSTGIGAWTSDVFVNMFKNYDSIQKLDKIGGPEEYNSLMPWNMYAGMTKEDLEAIFAYLRSLEPISNEVEKVTLKK